METINNKVIEKKKRGRPAGSSKKWRISYLNPFNKLPTQIEEYSNVNDVATKLNISIGVVYEMHKMNKKRYEFIKVEKI